MVDNISAVILAGGKSRRMGEDKSLLPFAGEKSLAEYQYKRLEKIFSNVHISCKGDKFGFTKNLIIEDDTDFAPTFGLKKIIEELNRPFFILGVDVPFFSKEAMLKLVDAYSNQDAVVASLEGKFEPLCGIYSPSIKPLIENSIRNNCHRLGKILKEANTKVIEIKNQDEFINMNTPDVYKRAKQLFEDNYE